MKIAIILVIVLLLVAGGGFGAATLGFVDIPGISPQKFGKAVSPSVNPTSGFLSTFAMPLKTLATKERLARANVKPKETIPDDSKTPKPNLDLGDAKLAELWGSMEPAKLVMITAKWPPNNLARVLVKMDSDQVSEYLGSLPADRAVKLSQAIQQFASLPPATSEPRE